MIARFTGLAVGAFERRFNIAPGQPAAVTVAGDPAPRALRWGLLAPWQGHGGVRPPPIHTAPLAAIATTPVLKRARRCVIHADGVYAKHKRGNKVQAWWLHGARLFAGLVATHRDDGVAAFALVTVPAPAALAAYTEELPAAVDEAWLDGGAPVEVAWRAVAISRWFEDVAHDDARCIAPLGNPAQGELF
ncbi:MAG: SOS response-associated peptidase family protein [Myxococcota bacterium]|nr:SOS response-associated peptidase family protein [Myxococcota bacterium]